MSGITDPTEEYFKDGSWGWDGTRWRKLNLTWGVYDRLSQDLGGVVGGAGTYTKASTAVPAGYVHVIYGITFTNNTGARGWITFAATIGGVVLYVARYATPVAVMPYTMLGPFVLLGADVITVSQASCVLNDVITAGIWGYKMQVT